MAEVAPLISPSADGSPDQKRSNTPLILGGVCGCCCCIYVLLLVVLGVIGSLKIASMQTPENYQVYTKDGVTKKNPQNTRSYEWWFACKYDDTGISNCGDTCCNCQERDAFRAYNSKAEYKEIQFPSRKGDAGQDIVQLSGYWLPANPTMDSGAAIIVVHGMGGTINDFRPSLIAYLVRSAGLSVLMPNIRGHGSSEAPKHGKMSWGWDYPYDVLGAWDYLRDDPDGKLGGSRTADHIGILGMSMGGFVAATAFGLEPNAAALWVDGPVYDPADVLKGVISKSTGPVAPILNSLVAPPAWVLTETLAGVDLNHHSPSKTLPKGSRNARPVMLVQSPDDADVPMFHADAYVKLFNENSERYNLSTTFDLSGTCVSGDGSRSETHNVLQWAAPEEYRLKICEFFSKALLDLPCNESSLNPSYGS